MAVLANCGPVLVADEDATSRDQLVRILEAAGYDVTQVRSGEEALQAAREVRPCIVLLEIPLGNLSGYEVCRALREEAGVPIVFVSGSRTESYDPRRRAPRRCERLCGEALRGGRAAHARPESRAALTAAPTIRVDETDQAGAGSARAARGGNASG